MATNVKSTHKAEVVPVVLETHPNADSLSIVRVFDYTVCARTQDWQGIDKAVYIQPDTIVDVTRPEFTFLEKDAKNGKVRIKAKRLRGVQSFGLLVPCPEQFNVGDDLFEYLGLEHYEPELVCEAITGGNNVKAPPLPFIPGKYDIDALRRYKSAFVEGEMCRLSEKVHGSNALYVWPNDELGLYARSRSFWKEKADDCLWWRAAKNTPSISLFCADNPGYFLYGEVLGKNKGFQYGFNGDVGFLAFDIQRPDGTWVEVTEFDRICSFYKIPTVPVLADVPFNFEEVCKYVDGKTLVSGATHIREGLICKPHTERWERSIGRVILKLVSVDYLAKN